MMGEFRIGEYTYRMTNRLDAFTQMAILFKIGPLVSAGFGEFAPLFVSLRNEGIRDIGDLALTRLGEIATPVARELAKMTDADRRFIIGTLLAGVERKRDGEAGWPKIWSVEAGRAMFEDINSDFMLMLRIALGAFMETFGGFLPAGVLSSLPANQAA